MQRTRRRPPRGAVLGRGGRLGQAWLRAVGRQLLDHPLHRCSWLRGGHDFCSPTELRREARALALRADAELRAQCMEQAPRRAPGLSCMGQPMNVVASTLALLLISFGVVVNSHDHLYSALSPPPCATASTPRAPSSPNCVTTNNVRSNNNIIPNLQLDNYQGGPGQYARRGQGPTP